MLKIRANLKYNPLLIIFTAIGILYVILAIFIPFYSFATLVVFILISLVSLSIVNMISGLVIGTMSVSERIITVLYSIIIFIFMGISLMISMQKPMFSTEIIMDFLIISFYMIGGIVIVMGIINTGYPNWFRIANFIFGLITLLISLIALMQPSIGIFLLILILTSLFIIVKASDKDV
jgi:hypothetical protein